MLRISPQFFLNRQIAKRYVWEETMEHSKQYVNCLGIQASHFQSTCYNTSLLQKIYVSTRFTNQKKTEMDFCFQGKRQKVKIAFGVCFMGSHGRMGAHPKQREQHGRATSLELNSASRYRATRASKCRSLSALSWFILCIHQQDVLR